MSSATMRKLHAALVAVTLWPLGCGAAPAAPAAAASPPRSSKDPDALLYRLRVEGEAEADAAARFERSVADAASLERLEGGAPPPGRRSLELRLVIGAVTQTPAGLTRTVTLVGTLPGGCQVLTFAPSLTKPGGRADDDHDRDELLDSGIGAVAKKLGDVAAKIGPGATCIATGK